MFQHELRAWIGARLEIYVDFALECVDSQLAAKDSLSDRYRHFTDDVETLS